MRRFLPGWSALSSASLLLSCSLLHVAIADDALPYIEVETFPVPTSAAITPTVLANLSAETGIAGTEIVGIRIKVGLAPGHVLERIEVGAADGLFLVTNRGFFKATGQFLIRVLRFLLLGQLATAGGGLEIPAQSWPLLFGGQGGESTEMMNLYTEREISLGGGDESVTNHGEYVVCRFLMAANQLSELIDLRIKTRNPRSQDWLSYRIPRVVLPLQGYEFGDPPQIGQAQPLGSEEYVGNSAAFGGNEPLLLAAYLRSVQSIWARTEN